jgi:hypothetical protein
VALYGFVRLHAREGQESSVEEALGDVTGHSRWTDESASQAHRGMPDRVRFLAQVDELLDQPREVARTERIGVKRVFWGRHPSVGCEEGGGRKRNGCATGERNLDARGREKLGRERVDHYWCGRRLENAQRFVENCCHRATCLLGQAKARRKPEKRG